MSAIELLLFDWLTVACWFEVADVVGIKLMVMVVSLLSGNCPREAGQTACQSKYPENRVNNACFLSPTGQMLPFGSMMPARFAQNTLAGAVVRTLPRRSDRKNRLLGPLHKHLLRNMQGRYSLHCDRLALIAFHKRCRWIGGCLNRSPRSDATWK
jgi:hypothetical protein